MQEPTAPTKIKALNVYQLDGLVALLDNKVLLIKQNEYEIDVVDMLTDEQIGRASCRERV